MSVLIKGMDEMPEDGAVLVVMHDKGKVYIKHACTYGYSMELVKLPETHGRLIDADALVEAAEFYETEMELKKAKTVIEAEE